MFACHQWQLRRRVCEHATAAVRRARRRAAQAQLAAGTLARTRVQAAPLPRLGHRVKVALKVCKLQRLRAPAAAYAPSSKRTPCLSASSANTSSATATHRHTPAPYTAQQPHSRSLL
jgi:hypothetical protein